MWPCAEPVTHATGLTGWASSTSTRLSQKVGVGEVTERIAGERVRPADIGSYPIDRIGTASVPAGTFSVMEAVIVSAEVVVDRISASRLLAQRRRRCISLLHGFCVEHHGRFP